MNVLVAGVNQLNAAGLASLIGAKAPGWKVAYVASREAIYRQLDQNPATVLLASLDLLGPPEQEIDIICRQYARMKLVVLLGSESPDLILQCLAYGALGCVPASFSPDELIQALRTVAEGRLYIPVKHGSTGAPHAAPHEFRDEPEPEPEPGTGDKHLTPRQRQVLQLLQQGQSTKQIARVLHLAVPTVKVHLAQAYRVIGARNRVEAAMRAGLMA